MCRAFWMGLMGVLITGAAPAEVAAPLALVLTSRADRVQPEHRFACNGTIHGHVALPQAAVGRHVLEGLWTDPKGKILQHSRDTLNWDPPGRRTAKVWLDFSPEGRLWNPLSGTRTTEADRVAYDGRWTVEVRWDGQTLARQPFEVRCR